MKMTFEQMTSLTSRGYLGTQIPEFDIDTHKMEYSMSIDNANPKDVVDMPDDWFMYSNGSSPLIGNQKGFLHLSRKGYEANKDRLKAAFLLAISQGWDRTNGRGWVAFEEEAEEFYSGLKKSCQKMRKNLKKKLIDLKKFEDNF